MADNYWHKGVYKGLNSQMVESFWPAKHRFKKDHVLHEDSQLREDLWLRHPLTVSIEECSKYTNCVMRKTHQRKSATNVANMARQVTTTHGRKSITEIRHEIVSRPGNQSPRSTPGKICIKTETVHGTNTDEKCNT